MSWFAEQLRAQQPAAPAPEPDPAKHAGGRPRIHASNAHKQHAYRQRIQQRRATIDQLTLETQRPMIPADIGLTEEAHGG